MFRLVHIDNPDALRQTFLHERFRQDHSALEARKGHGVHFPEFGRRRQEIAVCELRIFHRSLLDHRFPRVRRRKAAVLFYAVRPEKSLAEMVFLEIHNRFCANDRIR